MNALVGKLRRMADDKALPIGEAWNALDEAADAIEVLCVEIAKLRWNAKADEYNQWDELGQDEKDELIANARASALSE